MIKKILIIALGLILVGTFLGLDGVEAKKSKKGGLSEDDMNVMSTTIESLTKKMYGNCLFSPIDNENLISIKIKLDDQMLVTPDVALAPLYYKVGVLYKSRDMKDESIECFQTILENFGDTALAPKASAQLKAMGVAVTTPAKPGEGPAAAGE